MKTIKRINLWGRRHKKLLLASLLVYALALGVAIKIPEIKEALPREIHVGDKSVCYVENKSTAKEVVKDIKDYFVADGGELVSFTSNPKISTSYANPFKALSHIIPEKKAVNVVVDRLKKADSSKVTVQYLITEPVTFTPEPTYKQDETMLAGEKRVERSSAEGSKDVTSMVTAVNGKQVSKEKQNEVITKEGTSAIIYKGVLGLPDGEAWEEYEGQPVYNNAEDLVATAYNYIGAPYKHGGVSLQTGVSCVGFVRAIYLKYGIKIGNSHRSMETAGIGVSYSNARKGDIICYKGHVGLYVGDGKMLDATSSRGVGVNTVKPGKIIAVRRIVE